MPRKSNVIDREKGMFEDKTGMYDVLRSFRESFEFAIADVKNSINNIKDRLDVLEENSHIHIVDKAIHKVKKKSGNE